MNWSHSRNCESVVIQGYAGYDEFSLPPKWFRNISNKNDFDNDTDSDRFSEQFTQGGASRVNDENSEDTMI